MTSELGRRLRRTRKKGALSSRELSTLCGLSASALGHLERGETKSALGSTLGRVAHVLGLTRDWLEDGEGPEPTREDVRAAVARARAARGAS